MQLWCSVETWQEARNNSACVVFLAVLIFTARTLTSLALLCFSKSVLLESFELTFEDWFTFSEQDVVGKICSAGASQSCGANMWLGWVAGDAWRCSGCFDWCSWEILAENRTDSTLSWRNWWVNVEMYALSSYYCNDLEAIRLWVAKIGKFQRLPYTLMEKPLKQPLPYCFLWGLNSILGPLKNFTWNFGLSSGKKYEKVFLN